MAMRVGELARRTGVGVSALRAWERRYGLLQPSRSPSGHRLYDDTDVERVNAVVRLVEEGLHLAAAVARVSAGGPTALPLGEGEELFLAQILDRAEVGIWAARYGRTHYANLHLAQLLGCGIDEVLQRSVFDFFDPADQPGMRATTERVRAGKRSSSTVRVRRGDGTSTVVRIDATPLANPTGAYVGAVAVVSDHTEAQARERLLRLLSSALDAVADATVITAADGTILHVNAAAERTFGRRLTDLVGRDGQEVLGAAGSTSEEADLERTLVDGHRYAGRLRVAHHDGSTFLAHTTARQVAGDAGDPIGYVAVIHGQTEHDRVRRDLHNREAQAEAVALLGAQALRVRADPSASRSVAAEVVDTARRLVGAEEAVAFVLTAEGTGLQVLAAAPDAGVGPLRRLAGSVADLTRLTHRPVDVRDSRADPRFEPDGDGSALGVPIEGPTGPIGALVAVSRTPDRMDTGGLHFLGSVANILGGLVATSS